MENNLVLPALISLDEFEGDFHSYEEAVYLIFNQDFILSKPSYKGVELALKIYPITNGKEGTYYHITHTGSDEQNREPDLRRMERIGYPRPIIDNSESSNLKSWRNKRGNKERILILHESEQYLVVLEDRGEYILFWTAYYIEYKNKIRRLIKEHDEWHKKQKSPE